MFAGVFRAQNLLSFSAHRVEVQVGVLFLRRGHMCFKTKPLSTVLFPDVHVSKCSVHSRKCTKICCKTPIVYPWSVEEELPVVRCSSAVSRRWRNCRNT